jgi:hypothetical protein
MREPTLQRLYTKFNNLTEPPYLLYKVEVSLYQYRCFGLEDFVGFRVENLSAELARWRKDEA